QTLALRELLLFQILVADRRNRIAKQSKAHEIQKPDQSFREWVKGLPFKLTKAQNRAVAEIFEDLYRPHPMLRLMQGDVGSGKTVVAAIMMAQVARSGFQAAMMAPTEILAQQHYQTVNSLLQGSGLRIDLLTGSTPKPQRAQV